MPHSSPSQSLRSSNPFPVLRRHMGRCVCGGGVTGWALTAWGLRGGGLSMGVWVLRVILPHLLPPELANVPP